MKPFFLPMASNSWRVGAGWGETNSVLRYSGSSSTRVEA